MPELAHGRSPSAPTYPDPITDLVLDWLCRRALAVPTAGGVALVLELSTAEFESLAACSAGSEDLEEEPLECDGDPEPEDYAP